MPLVNIRIRNFRSLREVSVDATALTVFVGCNDEGKSNLLRALDLFFNSDRRGGYVLNWPRDFCAFAKTSANKAAQIEITLTFRLPSSFSIVQFVVWRRVWRQSGLHRDQIQLADGQDLPNRSKGYAYLKAIRYDYVPAIKGPEYFKRLLAAVHDMLDATVRSDIRAAAAGFTAEIRRHTKEILTDLDSQLGLKSDIELPSDLRQLFSELEFRSDSGGHQVALSQRGDGVKVRHIPVILRWLAKQANHLSAPGRPRVVTIWGYEEPENNLETRKCFDLAQFFIDTSAEVQTFLTTHSPVFYSVLNGPSAAVNLVEVQLDKALGTTLTPRAAGRKSDVDALHSSIGFLDLIEPHVREWKKKADQLEARLAEGIDPNHPSIFVEGPSDKTILLAVLKRYFPGCSTVRIVCSSRNGGGHAWVKDSLIAWHHIRANSKAVGLFDGDEASQPSIKEFKELVEDRAGSAPRALKVRIRPAGVALEITKAQLRIPVAIEELCPREAWAKAQRERWLQPRAHPTKLYEFSETDMTFSDWIQKKLPDDALRRVATHRVAAEFKEKFAKFVAGRVADESCGHDFEPLRKLVETLLEKVGVHEVIAP
jgi:predicted ATPase